MVDQPDAARYADLDAKKGNYDWDLDQDAEVGWAFEQTIFSGIYEAMNSRACPFAKTIPYGMCIRSFPGTLRPPNASSLELRGPYEAGLRRDLRFPVCMTHVGGMFTADFCEREVVQYGIERLRDGRSRVIDWGEIAPSRQASG